MPTIPAFDPTRAVGVILGASEWPQMPTLRDAPNAKTLTQTADYWHDLLVCKMGLHPANVLSLFDDTAPPLAQLDRVAGFLADREKRVKAARANQRGGVQDLFLIYIGHGSTPVTADSRYFLFPRCARDGRTDTLFDPVNIRQVLDAAVKGVFSHLFVDACYADSVKSAFGTWDDLPVVLFCAVDANTRAITNAGDDLTRFMTHVDHVLKEGIGGKGDKLSIHDVARVIQTRISTGQFTDPVPVPSLSRAEDTELQYRGLFPNPPRHAAAPQSPPATTPATAPAHPPREIGVLHITELDQAARVAVQHLIASLKLVGMTPAQADFQKQLLHQVADADGFTDVWEQLEREPDGIVRASGRFGRALHAFVEQLPKTIRTLKQHFDDVQKDLERLPADWAHRSTAWTGERKSRDATAKKPASDTHGTVGRTSPPAPRAGGTGPREDEPGHGLHGAVPVAPEDGPPPDPPAGPGQP